jgi:hypothetical protein
MNPLSDNGSRSGFKKFLEECEPERTATQPDLRHVSSNKSASAASTQISDTA